MSSSEVGTLGSYPSELEEQVEHQGRRLTLRPIRPEDSPQYLQFLAQITPEDLYHRFFTGVRHLPEEELRHFTHIDYDGEMAFVAVAPEGGEILGVARACTDHAGANAEIAVLVRSDLKGQGLGTLLMRKLIQYCGNRGMRQLWGSVMTDNIPMMRLCRKLGFRVQGTERNVAEIRLDLHSIETAGAS
jgi:acetyltransferase